MIAQTSSFLCQRKSGSTQGTKSAAIDVALVARESSLWYLSFVGGQTKVLISGPNSGDLVSKVRNSGPLAVW